MRQLWPHSQPSGPEAVNRYFSLLQRLRFNHKVRLQDVSVASKLLAFLLKVRRGISNQQDPGDGRLVVLLFATTVQVSQSLARSLWRNQFWPTLLLVCNQKSRLHGLLPISATNTFNAVHEALQPASVIGPTRALNHLGVAVVLVCNPQELEVVTSRQSSHPSPKPECLRADACGSLLVQK